MDVFDPVERAVLRFTDLLTSRPGNIDQSDVDALSELLSADQIVEVVLIVATANWTNRVNDGLQTPLS
jgi:alkylhydroperoxidase family enzyme